MILFSEFISYLLFNKTRYIEMCVENFDFFVIFDKSYIQKMLSEIRSLKELWERSAQDIFLFLG